MAESAGGFDAPAVPVDTIKEALLSAMALGFPVEESEQPTFHFQGAADYTYEDAAGNPIDWTATPTSSSGASEVSVLCAYEFSAPLGRQGAHETAVGQFNPTTLILTLIDDQFEEIRGFRYCTVGPSDEKWYFRFYQPAVGLGGMTVYQVTCTAEEPI